MNIKEITRPNSEIMIQEAEPLLLKQPNMYQIVMHNDDYTPMEFVVAVLEGFFNMDRAKATRVMYEVHMTGKAVCGMFSRDVAETKVDQITEYARSHEHPLLCSIEAL